MQASVQKRFSKGYQVQASYTLSKTMDNTQAQLGVDSVNTSVYPMNPYDPNADWAVASFDIRTRLHGQRDVGDPRIQAEPLPDRLADQLDCLAAQRPAVLTVDRDAELVTVRQQRGVE